MVLSNPNVVATGASTVDINPFGSTLTLQVGVYQLNYQYRFRSSSTTVITALIINNLLSTQQTGIRNYGFNANNSTNITVVGTSVSGMYCMGGTSIIVNTTPSNVLTASVVATYTPAGSLSFSGTYDCFVAVTRIG